MVTQGVRRFRFGLGDIILQSCNIPKLKEDIATNDSFRRLH